MAKFFKSRKEMREFFDYLAEKYGKNHNFKEILEKEYGNVR